MITVQYLKQNLVNRVHPNVLNSTKKLMPFIRAKYYTKSKKRNQRRKDMEKITKELYEFVQSRIEELLPLADENTSANNKYTVELITMSDIVIAYEKEHYPMI